MKRIIVILFMVVAAAALLQAASSKSDSPSILGLDGSVFFTPGTDAKKVEDKMAEALVRLDSWTQERAEKKSEPLTTKPNEDNVSNSPPGNFTLNNSTTVNSTISINSSLSNSSNVGSSTKGSFNGYYGMTASRHEMGKSGIDSRMFLSGNFEMDKTVKFQDQGVD
ncbi:MAG: hypothetical protein NTY37_12930 [Methanothrix sp.]|nr:hypothetical protein [Methanothrix sp.]